MKWGKLFSGNNMGLIMSMISGGTPDTGKILEAVSEMITDENVLSVVQELHKKYAEESARLGAGHFMSMSLVPVAERGLVLKLWDHDGYVNKPKLHKEIFLAEITAADVQAFMKQQQGDNERANIMIEGEGATGKSEWQQQGEQPAPVAEIAAPAAMQVEAVPPAETPNTTTEETEVDNATGNEQQ